MNDYTENIEKTILNENIIPIFQKYSLFLQDNFDNIRNCKL